MIRSVIALWPQPAQSVVLLPLYATTSRPMRLTFCGGAGGTAVVVAMLPSCLLADDGFGHAASVDGQAVIMQHAAQFGDLLALQFQAQQSAELGVAVLFDDIDPSVAAYEIPHLAVEGVGPQAAVVSH